MKVTIDSKTGEVKVNGKLLKDAETYLELLRKENYKIVKI